MKPKLPTEQQEAEVFADYLRKRGFLFTHLAQETSVKNWGLLMKQKRAGKNKGFPDYVIIVKDTLLFVELKRKKYSIVSPEQLIWNKALNNITGQVCAVICFGADEAIKFVESNK